MRVSTPERRALVLAVCGVLCMCAWAAAAMTTPIPDGVTDGFVVLAMVPCLLVATLLVARLPGAAITRLLVVYTLCNLIPVALDAGRLWQEAHGGASVRHDAPLAEGTLLGWLAAGPWWVGTLPLIPVMMVVVPDGVPRAGLWRWVFVGQLAALVLMLPTLVDQADGTTSQPQALIGAPAGAFLLAAFLARTVSQSGCGPARMGSGDCSSNRSSLPPADSPPGTWSAGW